MGQEDIKIRSLPRANDGAQPKAGQAKDSAESKKTPRWIIYVGTLSVILLVATIFAPNPKNHAVAAKSGKADLASTRPPVREISAVDRYLQDAQMKQQMMVQKSQIENMKFKSANQNQNGDDLTLPDPETNLGVHLDADNSAEQVYDDLNEATPENSNLPGDRINAHLANRKWTNELERRERIQVVTNFIRDAYDRGYAVDIDQNLIVVGVHPVNRTQKLNLNQVIDRLAKQGL